MNGATLRREDGWVLVSAIVLMGIMMTVGVALLSFVNTGSARSRESRERESSLAVAEAALYAQGFALTQAWPNSKQPLPGDCSQAGPIIDYCPTAANLAAGTATSQINTVDVQAGTAKWTTSVRDNIGPLADAYDPASANGPLTDAATGKVCPGPCRYDFNEDRQLWVQAKAVVRGKARNLVARLKLEELRESLPTAAVTAGGINVSNSGNSNIINGAGSTVLVRCNNPASRQCVNSDPGQITPAPQAAGTQPPLLTAAQLQRFRDRAKTDGRYYDGCPVKDPVTNQYDLAGTVVWVENCQSPPNLANNVATVPCTVPAGMAPNCVNTPEHPGLLIWHCGRADMQGSFTFVGVLYNANNSDGTCVGYTAKTGNCFSGNQRVTDNDLIVTDGGFGVLGALAIDGGGCLQIGSNGLQVKFDSNAFNAARSYGTVGLVQNTWRELKPN